LQFIVCGTPEFKEGLWQIVGRCTSDVHVGKRFLEYFPYTVIRSPDNLEIQSEYGTPRPINLLVEKIVAYRHEFETLSSGMTCLLIASGDASDLTDDVILRGASDE